MSSRLFCANGHEWPAPAAGPPGPCPVCGSAAYPPPTVVVPGLEAPARADGTVRGPTLLPEVSGDARSGPPQVPGYEVLEELGRGEMGVVYKARQRGLNRLVALKMLLGGEHAGLANLARFRKEAEAVARLQHPHVVQVYEIGEYAGCPYFSLEFCNGGSLAERLRAGPLPPRDAAALVELLARAVHAAHRAGIVHRDLKPANILLQELNHKDHEEHKEKTAGGVAGAASGSSASCSSCTLWFHSCTPRIADFGIAKRLDIHDGATQSGAVMGTPSYMAPEQASGHSKLVGPAADVYALGAILYECLTGQPPFVGGAVLDILAMVLDQEPAPPRRLNSGVPGALEAICLKCLRKEPGQRYSSALALAEDLRAFLEGEAVLAARDSSLELLRLILRESRHTEVLSRWGRVWFWHGALVLLLFLATDVLHWSGVLAAWPFALLWATGLVTFVVPVWWYRSRGATLPLTRIEHQIGQIWGMFVVAAVLTGVINHLLGLPAWQLLPVLVLECGLTFGGMAVVLGGSFYALALACALLSVGLAWEPRLGATAFGVCFAVGLWIPAWRYSRRGER